MENGRGRVKFYGKFGLIFLCGVLGSVGKSRGRAVGKIGGRAVGKIGGRFTEVRRVDFSFFERSRVRFYKKH